MNFGLLTGIADQPRPSQIVEIKPTDWKTHTQHLNQLSQQVNWLNDQKKLNKSRIAKQKITSLVTKRLCDFEWIRRKTEQAAKKGKTSIDLNKTSWYSPNPLKSFNYYTQKHILKEVSEDLVSLLSERYQTSFNFTIEHQWDLMSDYNWKLCLSWSANKLDDLSD